MSEVGDIFKSIPRIPAFFLFFCGVLVLGILLLFFTELTPELRQYLVPSLVAYVLGLAVIGSAHLMAWQRVDSMPQRLSASGMRVVVAVHIIWFGLLILYNYWRGSL